MEKKVIINADDFGISHGTNIGIEKAFKQGILTSASIMPTGPAFAEAVAIAKRYKGLGIGVHVSLTWGKSVLSPKKIPSLVDKDSYFYPSFASLLVRPLQYKNCIRQAEAEIQAQIEKVINSGLSIDHLNSQIHVHLIPWLFPIFTRMAKKYGIKYVRVPLEPLFALPFSSGVIKWSILKTLATIVASQKNLPKQFPTFYGVLFTSQMNKNTIKSILRRKDHGILEILSHPGYYDLGSIDFDFKKQGIDDFIKNNNRKRELETLLDQDLKKFIHQENIHLVNFSGMKKKI